MTKEEQYIQDCYRQVFSSGSGQKVLGQMLIDAGYFDNKRTAPEDMAVLNYVKGVLKYCGLLKTENIDSYVRNLFNIPTGAK